jgi:hypothetical protein
MHITKYNCRIQTSNNYIIIIAESKPIIKKLQFKPVNDILFATKVTRIEPFLDIIFFLIPTASRIRCVYQYAF